MRVCVLESSYDDSNSAIKAYDDRTHVSEYLEALGHTWDAYLLQKKNSVKFVRSLIKSGKYDVFLNICDGAWDDDTAGIEVVQALERYNVPFTGADLRFYDPTREEMKIVSESWGVKTPGYIITSDIADVDLAVKTLQFPMIVKHYQSYSSIGLHKNSRVENPEQLRERTQVMLQEFGEALIEEFIDGREFTVLVAENPDDPANPIVYNPIEFRFPECDGIQGFKHFDMKWVDFRQMSEHHVDDPIIQEKLKDMSKKVFLGLNGTGYGRCDIRMDTKGEIYLLEINPNCGVFYSKEAPGSADFILLNDPRGHVGFVDTILRSAFKRVRPKQKYRILLNRQHGFGLYAREHIRAGDIIIPYETKSHYLVSKSFANRTFDAQNKDWFNRYAYPVNDEVYAMWSDKPSEWTPINHSCDPNSWLVGLDLVARYDIHRGEEITMEYATFMNDQMPKFNCMCDSPQCRKVIRGTDYQLPSMNIYENHFSAFINQKRKQLNP